MAIDYPNSPSLNDQFTVGTTTWTYNGTAWVVSLGDASIATGAITADKIAASAVTTAKILDANVTAAKLASGAAVTNIGYTPANVAGPTFTGTVVLPSTTSIGTVSSTEIGYVDGVTSAIQTQLDSKLTTTTAITSNRNAVINGAMNVWQRGTSFNGSSPYYGADRWFFARPGAVAGSTLSRQSSGLTGFTYCARMQRDSGNTNTSAVRIFQSLETINSVQFAGKQITVSFYVRSGANYSGGANTYLNVGSGTGTDQQLGNTGFTGYALIAQLAVTPTSTWTRYSLTGSVSSSATEVGFEINYTPTGTAGANDYIEITGVQLEAGTVATPFEFEDFGDTLRKCMRYFQKSFRQDIAPATATGSFDGALGWQGTGSGFGAWCHKGLPVIMRSAPLVTLFNPVSANSQARNTASGVDIQTCTASGYTSTIISVASGTNDAAYQGSYIHYTLSSEL